jgi:hypothetical protein
MMDRVQRKPDIYYADLSNLPQALQPLTEQRRWVTWKLERRINKKTGKGKWTKPPYQPNGNYAKTDTESTWCSYQGALAAVQSGKADGIGFCLSNSGYAAPDLDDCRNPVTGKIDEWAKEIIKQANGAYVEATVSGTGLRIIGIAKGDKIAKKASVGAGAIELYRNNERYITISGSQIGNCKELPNIDKLIDNLHKKYIVTKEAATNEFDEMYKPTDGTGSGYGFGFMSQCKRDGLSYQAACKAILKDEGAAGEWARRVDNRQLERAWKNSGNGAQTDEEEDSDPGFRLGGESGYIKPEPDLIEGMVSQSGITLISGQSQAGKSFIAVMMLTCIATDNLFFGRNVYEKVGVLYVCGEGESHIEARLAACRRALNIPDNKLPAVYWTDKPPALDTNIQVDEYVKKLKELDVKCRKQFGIRLGLVCFDTAAACFELKKEEDNAEINRVCKRLKRLGKGYGGSVVPLHQMGKEISAGPRGASAWIDNSQFIQAVIANIDPISGAAEDRRQLAIRKARDGVTGPIGTFKLEKIEIAKDDLGYEIMVPYVKAYLDGEFQLKCQKTKAPTAMDKLESAIQEAMEEHGERMTFSKTLKDVYAVNTEQVRPCFYERHVPRATIIDAQKKERAKEEAFGRLLRAGKMPIGYGIISHKGQRYIYVQPK